MCYLCIFIRIFINSCFYNSWWFFRWAWCLMFAWSPNLDLDCLALTLALTLTLTLTLLTLPLTLTLTLTLMTVCWSVDQPLCGGVHKRMSGGGGGRGASWQTHLARMTGHHMPWHDRQDMISHCITRHHITSHNMTRHVPWVTHLTGCSNPSYGLFQLSWYPHLPTVP